MKKYIIKSLIFAGGVLALTSCDENSWNDKLDGFEAPEITDVQTIEYTMTAANYATLASNSTNVALAGTENAAALKAVGTQGYFTDVITPAKYAPAFLNDASFPYFTLSNGSSIKLTYNIWAGVPEVVSKLAAASTYTVTEDDYISVWGSSTDYANAFAPSKTASANLPKVLASAFPNATDGQYVIVNYNTSSTDPVFSATTEPETPSFQLSNTIATAKVGETITINGVVTALCSRGFILTDNSGSILVYLGSAPTYAIGDQITSSAVISSYGKGLQVANTSTFEVVGQQKYTYPTPTTYTNEMFTTAAARTTDELAYYITFTGTTKVSGNYYNIVIDGLEGIQGSVYYVTDDLKAKLVDGEKQTYTGYFTAVSGSTTKFINVVVTDVTSATKAPAHVAARVATVASTKENAVYTYSSGKWSVASSAVVLNPADYTAMGQSYGNLSGTLPAQYLPTFLHNKYPYAAKGDVKNVLYIYYASSASSYHCDQYVFNGTEWAINNGVTSETAQFVKNHGTWQYDPSVTVTLPAGKNQAISAKYYQACVNWVYNNIDVPQFGATSITSGVGYVTSYGNNEYYSGTSAYQNNVDLRAASAIAQCATGYAGMTNDEVVALMKERFTSQVMPGALSTLHPDAMPVDGIDVIYTINFSAYDGSATNAYTAKFKVVGPAKFECIECNW